MDVVHVQGSTEGKQCRVAGGQKDLSLLFFRSVQGRGADLDAGIHVSLRQLAAVHALVAAAGTSR